MRNGGVYRFFNLLVSHGMTVAITVLLAVRAGIWLDKRLNTAPLFLILLVLLIVVVNLRLLIKDLMTEVDRGSPRPGKSGFQRLPDQGGEQTEGGKGDDEA